MKPIQVVTLMLVLSSSVVAQGRPDFSGQWLLVSASAENAADGMTVELGMTDSFSTARRPLFRRLFASFEQPREYVSVERFKNNYMSVSDITVVSSSVLTAFGTERGDLFAVFDGQTLVMQRPIRFASGENQSVRQEIWSLTLNGLLRITTTIRSSRGQSATTEAFYQRPRR